MTEHHTWPLLVAEEDPVLLTISNDESAPVETDSQIRMLVEPDYNNLRNKPSIEGVPLIGDNSFRQLGLDTITEADIDEIMFGDD